MENIQLIIPMSGVGKRFLDSGYEDPKPLIMVDGKSIIEHVVNLFPGVSDVTFICNEVHTKMEKVKKPDGSIVEELKTLYCLLILMKDIPLFEKYIGSDFDDKKQAIVSYCDYGTYWDFNKFLK